MEVHENFFDTMFELYIIDYHSWIKCQCADSAEVNHKIAKLSHGLHVSCKNHKLGLAGKTIIDNDQNLNSVLERIGSVSSHIKSLYKVSAVICNEAASVDHRLANLSAKCESETRKWLGSTILLQQQKKLAPYINDCVTKKVARMREYADTASVNFLEDVDTHLKYLVPLCKGSEKLQKHGLRL